MKKVLFVIVLIPLFSLSQEVDFELKKIHKHFTFFEDSKSLCHYEVSNYWYSIYLDSTQSSRPDSTLWSLVDPTGVMSALYHSQSSYDDHPVVNIQKSEAEAFCSWLTTVYSEYPKKKYEKVVFRLPTKEEWIKAAYSNTTNKALFPFKKKSRSLTDKKGYLRANYYHIHESCLKKENGKLTNMCKDGGTIWINAQNSEGSIVVGGAQQDLTVRVDLFEQNKKLCNLAGNAYEMTSSEIIGGSYNSTGYYLSKYAVPKNIEAPHPEIGFRLLMEIVEK